MADAYEDRIADAMVTELNAAARDWDALFNSEGTTAAKVYSKRYSGSDLATLKCAVVPTRIERVARLARSNKREFRYVLEIHLIRTFGTSDDNDDIETWNTAAEQIQDWFDDNHEVITNWRCLVGDRASVIDFEAFYPDRTWETIIEVFVQGFR